VIFILALATKEINQGKLSKFLRSNSARSSTVAEKFAKKALLGENEIESTLGRLDRLTGDESKMAVAQVYKVVMEGVHGLLM
jgi:hypothetical protein